MDKTEPYKELNSLMSTNNIKQLRLLQQQSIQDTAKEQIFKKQNTAQEVSLSILFLLLSPGD